MGGKKVRGRKRHIVLHALGLLPAMLVTAAQFDEAKAAQQVFIQTSSEEFPRLELQAVNKYHNNDLGR